MELSILSPTSRAKTHSHLGLGCQSCPFLEPCGGSYSDYDCLGDCCNDPEGCEIACPRSARFAEVVRDCGGWDRKIPTLRQARRDSPLPAYIPCIQHGYQRSAPLHLPIAVIPTFAVTSRRRLKRFASGAELRACFGLAPTTRVILLSVNDDPDLERYWKYAEVRFLPEYLASLDIDYITAPNFSFALNVPRTEHLVNRSRSLRCIEEFSKAGMSVVPHLNACTERQWDFWADFLKEHVEIEMIAKEFQTGLAIPRIAHWHVNQLQRIQARVGRELHLIAVAGRRHIALLTKLPAFSVVDSEPFFKTHFRRRISRLHGKWAVNPTPYGEPLDELMAHNIKEYTLGIEQKVERLRQFQFGFTSDTTMPTRGDDDGVEAPTPSKSQDQLELWDIPQLVAG